MEDSNIPVLRLSELDLIAAEAAVKLNNKDVYKRQVHSVPIIIIAFCYLSKSTFFSIFSKKNLYRLTMFLFWLVLSLKID